METELIIKSHIPTEFQEWAISYWKDLEFRFIAAGKRKSKLGDFRYNRTDRSYTITVNRTLNPWAFLVTYTHEVAHCITHKKFGPRVKHHGKEWKSEYRALLLELISSGKLPEGLVRPLALYAKNPRASSYSFPSLVEALRKFDERTGIITLNDLTPGTAFRIDNKEYTFINKRRTRALCLQQANGKRYLVSLFAEVDPL